jgi:hypothetical protein
MLLKQWPNGKIKTSGLGFGCMRFKTNEGKVDEELAIRLLQKAYKKGINYFDTAIVYLDGQSEPVLGKAMKPFDRDSFYIASKYSLWSLTDPAELDHVIDRQLANLQTDYIDFYLLHAISKDRLQKIIDLKLIEVVKRWQQQGKIRYIGFSFHDDYETFMKMLDLYPWDFCQIQFNYVDKDIQQGMQGYQELIKRNIPIVVMEPLKGGSLAKFNETVEAKFKARSSDSMAKWAFRWVSSMPGVKVALSGMNEESQLDENLAIYQNFKKMTPEEFEFVEAMGQEFKRLEVVGCTKCRYCMPCPFGVYIPDNFEVINEHMMYKNDRAALWDYGYLESKKGDASACMNCQACLEKCPQHIDIPNRLIDVAKLMKEIRANDHRS